MIDPRIIKKNPRLGALYYWAKPSTVTIVATGSWTQIGSWDTELAPAVSLGPYYNPDADHDLVDPSVLFDPNLGEWSVTHEADFEVWALATGSGVADATAVIGVTYVIPALDGLSLESFDQSRITSFGSGSRGTIFNRVHLTIGSTVHLNAQVASGGTPYDLTYCEFMLRRVS